MANPEFVYTTYIKTTPEKLWAALTNPEFTIQYWGGYQNISDWKKGSKWKHVADDKKTVRVVGEIVECVPAKRLVFTWYDPNDPADVSRVTYELESAGELVRLNVVHGDFKAGSIMAGKVSKGWPLVLSSLKSFLETGRPIDIAAVKQCGASQAAAHAG